jgi:uncharacterized protein (DUF2147 family)
MKLVATIVTAISLSFASSAVDAAPASTRMSADATPLDTVFPADSLVGTWWTEGKEGLMKIVKTKSGLFEVLLQDGKDADKKDVKNPDPKLRDRKLRGIVIMWHLHFEDGEYVDGYCYNPRDGNTYRVKMRITGPSSLRLRGYLGISLLGQNQDWTRAG